MATKKKLLQAAAGQAGGAGLNVEEVFSTYLYDGTGANQTITNGIDLSGEGGLVWIKSRSNAYSNYIYDTERGTSGGAGYYLATNSNIASTLGSVGKDLYQFNSDGFELGPNFNAGINNSGYEQASWTFRKAPKFFDVVTYTGNDTAGTTIPHNLGVAPGVIIVKSTSAAGDWAVYHRSLGATQYTLLNGTGAAVTGSSHWHNTTPTSTEFTLGGAGRVNYAGRTYVAYLFAHNDGDGEFGPTGDQDIIKCGSYVGSTDNTDLKVTLGWEPQFVIIKNTSQARSWGMFDAMRGLSHGSNAPLVNANSSGAEDSYSANNHFVKAAADGFIINSDRDWINNPSDTYIYIAIRRGPMAVPESATEVFAQDYETYTNLPQFYSGWPVDFALRRLGTNTTNYTRVIDRLRGNQFLNSTSTNSEGALTIDWDVMDGFSVGTSSDANDFSWMWKRAPSFFDVVAYTGNGTAGRTVSHNLGVAPEMIWVKRRSNAEYWPVLHKDGNGSGSPSVGQLESTAAFNTGNLQYTFGDDTVYIAPDASGFTVSDGNAVNRSGDTYIAYLFASLDGVSKVGSYTGNGSTQTINCGFSSGARFVLIKRTDSTGDWYIWDTERGIVAANDPHLSLNTTAAEVTTDDSIDPVSSGFAVNQVAATNINVSSASYIYYAVA